MSPPLPKKKKEKEVPKSQSGGMNGKDVQTCRNILKKLVAHKSSVVFRQPVDPVRDRAPG
jgi:transcription initiation factor TFIID subunit 2